MLLFHFILFVCQRLEDFNFNATAFELNCNTLPKIYVLKRWREKKGKSLQASVTQKKKKTPELVLLHLQWNPVEIPVSLVLLHLQWNPVEIPVSLVLLHLQWNPVEIPVLLVLLCLQWNPVEIPVLLVLLR